MEPDDQIRAALREYAEGSYRQPDLDVIRSGHRPGRRLARSQQVLVAAVLLAIAIAGAAILIQAFGSPRQEQPIAPTPSPSTTTPPSPSPTPSASGFGVNPGAGVNPGPIGGVGDTVAGLRLDDVQIVAGRCGSASCPAIFTMTLTNTTDAAGTWEVLAYVYRNGYAELGNGTRVTLGVGAQTDAVITIDTGQAAQSGKSSTYTWNWSAILAP